MAWWLLWACGGAPVPPFSCPDGAELREVDPRWGGRTAWCARKNDTKHGPWMEWGEDGTLLKSSAYHNNRRQGLHRQWDVEGRLREEATYEEGKLHGARTLYREDGSVEVVERYEKGKRLD